MVFSRRMILYVQYTIGRVDCKEKENRKIYRNLNLSGGKSVMIDVYTKSAERSGCMDTLERVIRENNGWLFAWLRGKTGDRETAEDLVQEVWIRVVRAWDGYREDGKLRAWLKRIAMNVYLNHIAGGAPWICLSLDACGADEDPLADTLTDGITAEDAVLEQALTEDVLAALAGLPENQRRVLTYRYLFDMTIPEVAKKLDMAPGSVKSSTHYGLSALRKQLGADEVRKGEKHMECRDVMQVLFVYAKGILKENRTEVEKHLKECESCRKMADALEKLVPHLPEDKVGISHFNIHFPEKKITYVGVAFPFGDAESQTARLQALGSVIPDGETWLDSGFGDMSVLDRIFDNEGNEIGFEVYQRQNNHYRIRATRLEKLYPYMWQYMSCHDWDGEVVFGVWQDKEDPALYCGKLFNAFDAEVKSAMIQMIPAEAKNIHIRKGNGVIDCGGYKAVYADRYVGADETIWLEYTFTL